MNTSNRCLQPQLGAKTACYAVFIVLVNALEPGHWFTDPVD